MDTKLTAALACAAALTLGACSGVNPPAPAAPENEIAGPETAETETTETKPPDPGTGVPEPGASHDSWSVTIGTLESTGPSDTRERGTDSVQQT